MTEMTVSMLIAHLKKMPPRARVVYATHDQDTTLGEFDGSIHAVSVAPPAILKRGYAVVLS